MDKREIPFKPGVTCRVRSLGGDTRVSDRLAQMGIMPGMELTIQRAGPLGNPLELAVPGGQSLALRKEEIRALQCELVRLPLSAVKAGNRIWRVAGVQGGRRLQQKLQARGVMPGAEFRVVAQRPMQLDLASGEGRVRVGQGEAAQIIVEPMGSDL